DGVVWVVDAPLLVSLFLGAGHAPRGLHSFPTRRSSDLDAFMSPIISVSNLSKTYGSGFKALKGINLDINRGEIFALLGPNGAGKDRKSTRLNSSHVKISYAVFCLKKKRSYYKSYPYQWI